MMKKVPAKATGDTLPKTEPVKIISDLPETESINFGFDAYAKTLAELIANKKNKTPLVVGVYGPWGTGKTTLMDAVKELLDGKTFENSKEFRPCKTVWFQAWKYDKEDEILAGLIGEIFKTIKYDESMIERLKGYAEETVTRLNVWKVINKLAKPILGVDVDTFLSDPTYKSKLGFYDTFQEFFTRLVWTYTRLRPKFDSSEKPDDTKGALVVFIDDLDRCPQSRIVKVLETIKLFMDHPGCVFVIGADEEIIRKALSAEKNYEQGDSRKFLEKIIQVTFSLPHLSEMDFGEFMEELDENVKNQLTPHLNTIVRTTQLNPRRFKRFINDLYLMAGIHRNKNTGIDFDNLLRWKIILFEAPDIQNETPESVWLLKSRVEAFAEQADKSGEWLVSGEKIKEIMEVSFRAYLENRTITMLFKQLILNEKQIHQLITLSESLKGAEEELEEAQAFRDQVIKMSPGKLQAQAPSAQVQRNRKRELRLLDLDVMAPVPAGVFEFGEGEKQKTLKIEKPFEIDVYPVTNGQFERFIKDDGYNPEKEFWDEEGREFLRKEKITQPRYWDDEQWNQPDHPVVGVSWYEADAYARWAGKSLPTEMERERAARGTDGREYPWEGAFDKEKCNTSESGIDGTTRVTRYPNGISPVGCYDMAGNVWEWTSSFYDDDKDSYVLRGGSWIDDHGNARCARRDGSTPEFGFNSFGFRCVRTLT